MIGPVMARLAQVSFEEADATVMREVFAGMDSRRRAARR